MNIKKPLCLILSLLLMLLYLNACALGEGSPEQAQKPGASVTDSSPDMPDKDGNDIKNDNNDDAWRISVITSADGETWSFTETELAKALENQAALPSGIPGQFSHSYSTVNNWPSPRSYAAEGFSVASILTVSGLYESAQTVTFRGADGYEVSLTREQLLAPQYYYPQVNENDNGAETVYPLIAYRWREGTDDLSSIRDENPCLIIGQRNPFEHTNPAFVENISEIIVSDEPCEAWLSASTFPLPGPIAAGETVKLQHPDYGLVKMHYTLDGSDPTMLSPMYNPSTYQPELNVPIPITEPTVIKVLVCGYGKADSGIAVFEFTPQ